MYRKVDLIRLNLFKHTCSGHVIHIQGDVIVDNKGGRKKNKYVFSGRTTYNGGGG